MVTYHQRWNSVEDAFFGVSEVGGQFFKAEEDGLLGLSNTTSPVTIGTGVPSYFLATS
jgi:hypothetical protein